jgi:hypothetical protein
MYLNSFILFSDSQADVRTHIKAHDGQQIPAKLHVAYYILRGFYYPMASYRYKRSELELSAAKNNIAALTRCVSFSHNNVLKLPSRMQLLRENKEPETQYRAC